ncbi:hypothetical protein TRIP_C20034 [Candidatus Zixiibacteriota bacterium]|nr:hypothetical protein TRIP_C20034 [candidate division Zixibacteria bacterium]
MAKIVHSTEIPNDIRHVRKSRHLVIKEVAKLMGQKSASHIAHWEKGRKLPSLINLFKLAAVLGIQPQFLFQNLYREIRKEIHDAKVKYDIFEQYD